MRSLLTSIALLTACGTPLVEETGACDMRPGVLVVRQPVAAAVVLRHDDAAPVPFDLGPDGAEAVAEPTLISAFRWGWEDAEAVSTRPRAVILYLSQGGGEHHPCGRLDFDDQATAGETPMDEGIVVAPGWILSARLMTSETADYHLVAEGGVLE